MRLLLLFGLLLVVNACSNRSNSFNRGYVISKSQETAAEMVTEPPEQ